MTEKPEGGLAAAVQERVHAPRAGMSKPVAAAATRDPLREPMRSKRSLSDEEVLRMFEKEESNPFEFDQRIVPEGYRYVWKCHEVYGNAGRFNAAELERRKFVQVMAEEHPGYFKPNGHTGHIIRDGQGLYKLETENYDNRVRYEQIVARRQVQDQEQVLGIAPAGHGPRDHHGVRPQIKVNYEAFDVE